MKRAIEYNLDFAWLNGFGGGLVPPDSCSMPANPFTNMEPGTDQFYFQTKSFQALYGLKPDGVFGPKTFEKYKAQYGPPTLQVEGVDISGYQRPDRISIPKLKAVGLAGFMFIKFIESVYRNIAKHAATHCNTALQNGVDFGGYLFVRTDKWNLEDYKTHARDQALNYLRAKATLPHTTLLDVVDAEHKGFKEKDGRVIYGAGMLALKRDDRQEYVGRLTEGHAIIVQTLKEETGEVPLLYSYPGYLNRYLKPDRRLTQCQLWNSIRYKGSPTKYAHHRVSDKWGRLVIKQWQTDGSDPRVLENYGRRLDINQAPYGIGPFLRR